ncbi:MAG: ribosomal protein S6--L-glutamate ligase [Rickettsiales bacterium]|jgi:ribosomal protein S6--L-glutamate ligase
MAMDNKNKITIGWQEIISLPDLSIPAIEVKVDTGAKTSSLHAENIEFFHKNGHEYISFDVHPIQKHKEVTVKCQAPVIEKRNVKSSSGCQENRPMIKTKLKIGDHIFEIDLNLTKRDYMKSRMLLGRDAMKNHIIIDPEHKYLHGKLSSNEIELAYKNKK